MYQYRGVSPDGFPHSDISGLKPACGYPKLFAACHVLLRHVSPRHPPVALRCLITTAFFKYGLSLDLCLNLPYSKFVNIVIYSLSLRVFSLQTVKELKCSYHNTIPYGPRWT